MNLPLDDNSTKYQVKVLGRIVCETHSRVVADLHLQQLSENDKANATIVTVAANGNQVLFG